METLVRMARAGPPAIRLLEETARKDSKWSASTRELVEDSLGLLCKAELRKALAEYDLATMDSVRVGKLAPDFALKDATRRSNPPKVGAASGSTCPAASPNRSAVLGFSSRIVPVGAILRAKGPCGAGQV
jgi:hypothetical protein